MKAIPVVLLVAAVGCGFAGIGAGVAACLIAAFVLGIFCA